MELGIARTQSASGFAPIGKAKIYYELAGQGQPFVMIHAGVADSRQWNNEFAWLAERFRAVRYDMRGYGKSEPAEGEFSHMADLLGVLDQLEVREPLVIMGCSMGGRLAMDFALAHPSRVRALVMVGAGPSGLELDVPTPAKFAEAEPAFKAGDLERVCELEIQIWFDWTGRTPEQVNQPMRRLAYEMNRMVLAHEVKQLGTRKPDTQALAFERLPELQLPMLVIVGAHDTPYILAAADYIVERVRSARKVIIADAAHLANLDHPDEFKGIVTKFLDSLPPGLDE